MPNSLIVEILGNGKEFAASLDEASSKTARFGKAAKIAGAALLGGLAYGLDKSVEAAVHVQEAQAKLDTAFKNSGLNVKAYAKQIDGAEVSGRRLGFTNQDVLSSLSTLIVPTKNVGESMKLLAVAQDVARSQSVPLSQATGLVAKAMTGSTRALKALGLQQAAVKTSTISATGAQEKALAVIQQSFGPTADLTKAQTIQEQVEETAVKQKYAHAIAQGAVNDKAATGAKIIQLLTSKYQGQAAAFSGTLAGKMDTFKANLDSIGESIGDVVLPSLESFAGALAKLAGWMSQHQTVAKILVAGLAALGVTLVAVVPVVSAFGTALAFVAANPIVLLVAGLALLAGAIAAAVLAPKKLEEVLEKMGVSAGTASRIVHDLQDAFSDLKVEFEAILPIVKKVFEGIVNEISGAFSIVKGIFDVIDGLLHGNWSQVWDGLKDIVHGAMQAIEGILQAATAVLGALMGAIMNAMWSAAKSVWSTIIGWFEGLPGDIVSALGDLGSLLLKGGTELLTGLYNGAVTGWGTASSWLENLPQTILNAIGDLVHVLVNKGMDLLRGFLTGQKNGWEDIGRWLAGLPGKILSAIGDLGHLLLQKGIDLLHGFLTGEKNGWIDIGEWLGSLPSKILSTLGNLGHILYNAGAALIQGLWNGIKAEASGLLSYVGGLAHKVASFFKNPLKILSPSKVFFEIGQNLMKGLQLGIQQSSGLPLSAVSGVANSLTGPIGSGRISGGSAASGGPSVSVNVGPVYGTIPPAFTQSLAQQLAIQLRRGGAVDLQRAILAL